MIILGDTGVSYHLNHLVEELKIGLNQLPVTLFCIQGNHKKLASSIKEEILKGLKVHEAESFSTIHNYIDMDAMILRKGAVSAKAGERLLIPINMRDGSLICTGLGNEDWNCSAPHGAVRLFSRTEAENRFSVYDFKKQMEGIYTTSVS